MSASDISSLVSGLEITPSNEKRNNHRRFRRSKQKTSTQAAPEAEIRDAQKRHKISRKQASGYTQEQLDTLPEAERELVEAKRAQTLQKNRERRAKKKGKKLPESQNVFQSEQAKIEEFFAQRAPRTQELEKLRAEENEKIRFKKDEIANEITMHHMPLTNTDPFSASYSSIVYVLHRDAWLDHVRSFNGYFSLADLLHREQNILFTWPPLMADEYQSDFEMDPNNMFMAVDCEMVETEKTKNFPARVSLVNYYGEILLDTYVEPDAPVVQWRTRYSGISPKVLQQASKNENLKSFEYVVNFISNYVNGGNILMGHDLSSDLRALKYFPPKPSTVDTQKLGHFKTDCGGNGLRRLIDHYFNIKIQQSRKGHDSVEDARASMMLFRLFQREFHKLNGIKYIESD